MSRLGVVMVAAALLLVCCDGCARRGHRVESRPFALTIIVESPLGELDSPLPDDIIQFSLPLTDEQCPGLAFVPKVEIVRVDVEPPISVTLSGERDWIERIQGFFRAHSLEMLDASARRRLAGRVIGDALSRPGPASSSGPSAREALKRYLKDHARSAVLVYPGRLAEVLHGQRGGRRAVVPAGETVDEFRAELSSRVCSSSSRSSWAGLVLAYLPNATSGGGISEIGEASIGAADARPTEETAGKADAETTLRRGDEHGRDGHAASSAPNESRPRESGVELEPEPGERTTPEAIPGERVDSSGPEGRPGAMRMFEAARISAAADGCPNPNSPLHHPDGFHGVVRCHYGALMFLRTKAGYPSTYDRAVNVAAKLNDALTLSDGPAVITVDLQGATPMLHIRTKMSAVPLVTVYPADVAGYLRRSCKRESDRTVDAFMVAEWWRDLLMDHLDFMGRGVRPVRTTETHCGRALAQLYDCASEKGGPGTGRPMLVLAPCVEELQAQDSEFKTHLLSAARTIPEERCRPGPVLH